MKPIREKKVVVIDITNVCNLSCSNCTRFCGHYPKDKLYFMDPNYFEKALLSLEGFDGVIGLIGGEPTLHPEFEKLCEIFSDIIPRGQRGLWSNTITKQWEKNHND